MLSPIYIRQSSSALGRKLRFRGFASQSGTVKFYIREKGYGFLQPDGGGSDVFVHRTGIQTDVPLDVSIQHPFLRKGERVRFDTIPDTGLDKAVQVTWLNGTPIPPLRKNYLGSVHERARRILGDHCYAILSDESLTEEERMTKVNDAFEYSKSIIINGEDLITRLGLNVEDFPTHATSDKGKYRFTADDGSEDDVNEVTKQTSSEDSSVVNH